MVFRRFRPFRAENDRKPRAFLQMPRMLMVDEMNEPGAYERQEAAACSHIANSIWVASTWRGLTVAAAVAEVRGDIALSESSADQSARQVKHFTEYAALSRERAVRPGEHPDDIARHLREAQGHDDRRADWEVQAAYWHATAAGKKRGLHAWERAHKKAWAEAIMACK